MHEMLVKDIRDFLANPTHCEEGDHAADLLKRVMGYHGISLVAPEDVTAESLVRPYDYPGSPSHILSYDFRAWFPEEVFYDNHDVVRFLKSSAIDTSDISFDAEACQLYAYGPREALVAAAQVMIDKRNKEQQ